MIGFLIDLDGTMYHGGKMIPKADQFIQYLREKHIPFLFVTNNSSRTPEGVARHLTSMGIEAYHDDVYTTSLATAQYIKDHNLGQTVYLLGEEGLAKALEEKGIVIDQDGTKVDLVVQGIDREFNYHKLTRALQLIHLGAKSILTNPDHLLPSDDMPIPGAGSIASAIQTATRVEPIIIGKPSPIIMEYAIEKLTNKHPDLKREEIWVVGDNLNTDIKAGMNVGLPTGFVLTGISKKKDLEQLQQKPTKVAADLMELIKQLL